MLQLQEIYETEITGYTSDGRGVARIDGCVVFVPNTIAGERCRVRILHIGKHGATGKIESILEKSPHRVPRACPNAKLCGGCCFWHMDYEEECRLKAQRVRDALQRIGGYDPGEVPITGGGTAWHYRNKAQYPVAKLRGRAEAGFFRAGTHQVIPVETCLIQHPAADQAKAAVLSYMRRCQVPPYNEATCTGLVRHIYVRRGWVSGQVLVGIVANGTALPQEKTLAALLQQQVEGLCSVVLCVNTRPGNAILGREFRTIWGVDALEDTLCGLQFRISPRSFYQVNHDQAERLYEKALQLAALDKTQTVLDLYCGTGTITCIMARSAGRSIGVEVIPEAVEDAKQNAARNSLENVTFLCADAGQAAQQLAERGTAPDVIVVDPPRKGLDETAVQAAAAMQPRRIVYVSCDPATLARDIKRFAPLGYVPAHVEAVDLFPRTAHVETVVLLSHKKPDPPALSRQR